MRATNTERAHGRRDAGHTGVEMVVVLALVGLLASITALLVTGMRTQAADSGCSAEARILHVAATAYLVTAGADSIPATGTDHDRYESTLVVGGHLRRPSVLLDLGADGVVIIPEGSPC